METMLPIKILEIFTRVQKKLVCQRKVSEKFLKDAGI